MNAASPNSSPAGATLWWARWQRLSAACVRGFHGYAGWLVGISWRRFLLLSLLLLTVVAIVHDLPPFTWTVTERVPNQVPRVIVLPRPAKPEAPVPPAAPAPPTAAKPAATADASSVRIQAPGKTGADSGVEIIISKEGVRIGPQAQVPAQAASAADAADAADAAAQRVKLAADNAASAAEAALRIVLPPGEVASELRVALEEARKEIEQAVREARRDAAKALRDADEAKRDAQQVVEELLRLQDEPRSRTRVTRYGIGDVMMQFTLLWIMASAIIKFTYKGRMQAEVKAAQATETAEAESLKRQVIEARMAAMQAQVEPHFLFNTLASIDHLIETDPPRASQMQKNLIALLRASMPTMREASGNTGGTTGVRDLGREIAVIRPYLEILKVRMEERLSTAIDVPAGLLSAEFPPMMLQTLVENAIKHGLEPKAEGGRLQVAAEIVHGKLQMRVADTGLGFGKAATAGTGVGLANIRERLQLLYGQKASLTVSQNSPSGTVVTITVPYKTVEAAVA